MEKKFKIETVASIVENKVLIDSNNIEDNEYYVIYNKFLDDIFDLCSFIIGEKIDYYNFEQMVHTIKSLIYMQYPDMENFITNQYDFYVMGKNEIKETIKRYKFKYGNYITIKPLKKVMVKSLKLED